MPTLQSLSAIDRQLENTDVLSPSHNALQHADLSVTRQWMRLLLWKLAIPVVPMVTTAPEQLNSMLFPATAARQLLSTTSDIPLDILEAHGPGMELKLFSFANSVADVLTCLPDRVIETSALTPRAYLVEFARKLTAFRGSNSALLPVLQSRLADVGLDVPAPSRIQELGCDFSDSDDTNVSIASLNFNQEH